MFIFYYSILRVRLHKTATIQIKIKFSKNRFPFSDYLSLILGPELRKKLFFKIVRLEWLFILQLLGQALFAVFCQFLSLAVMDFWFIDMSF